MTQRCPQSSLVRVICLLVSYAARAERQGFCTASSCDTIYMSLVVQRHTGFGFDFANWILYTLGLQISNLKAKLEFLTWKGNFLWLQNNLLALPAELAYLVVMNCQWVAILQTANVWADNHGNTGKHWIISQASNGTRWQELVRKNAVLS